MVVERIRRDVRDAGGPRVAIDRVVLGRDDGRPWTHRPDRGPPDGSQRRRVEVHDIDSFVAYESAQPANPADSPAAVTEAVDVDADRLELAREGVRAIDEVGDRVPES